MRRAGFTLVELLVVIAIIAVLMGLSGAAYVKVMSTQKKRNTRNLMVQIETGALAKKVQAARDAGRLDTAKPDGVTPEAWADAQVAQHYPRTFPEALAPPLGQPSRYAAELAQCGVTPANAATVAPPEMQAAVLLWMALRKGYHGTTPLTEQDLGGLGVWTSPSGKQVPFVKDAWDRPVTFTRSAAQDTGLNPNGAKLVLASAGPDGQFGFDATTAVTFFGPAPPAAARDNIYSTQP